MFGLIGKSDFKSNTQQLEKPYHDIIWITTALKRKGGQNEGVFTRHDPIFVPLQRSNPK